MPARTVRNGGKGEGGGQLCKMSHAAVQTRQDKIGVLIFCRLASYYNIDVDSESHDCFDHLGTFK